MHHRHDIAELDAAALDGAAPRIRATGGHDEGGSDEGGPDEGGANEGGSSLIPRYSLPEMAVLFTDVARMDGLARGGARRR